MEPSPRIYTISDVQVMLTKGPWMSKSGGQLWQHFQVPNAQLPYLNQPVHDLSGLRMYSVQGIQAGAVGAREWHERRWEFSVCYRGRVRWTIEDVHGQQVTHELGSDAVILIPPLLFHTYEVLADGTDLVEVVNTTFDPDDPATHDTFGREAFDALAARIDKI